MPILNAPRYHFPESRYPRRPFFGAQPRCSSDRQWVKGNFHEPQNKSAIFFHALVFFLVYSLIAKAMGLVLTRTDLVVTTVLFLALSPGLLLTLPPGSGGVMRSGQTSLEASLTHAIVFAVVFALLRRQFPQFY